MGKIAPSVLCFISPSLWNQLSFSLRQPHSGTSSSISYSPIPSPITSSSSVSPLCTSITPSLFHSRLKTYLFHKYTKTKRLNYCMFACPLFRELNKAAKLKGMNIDTVSTLIGITHVLKLCGLNSPK